MKKNSNIKLPINCAFFPDVQLPTHSQKMANYGNCFSLPAIEEHKQKHD